MRPSCDSMTLIDTTAARQAAGMTMDTATPHKDDDAFMREALTDAAQAEARGEVPVGAILVRDQTILARGGNAREHRQDPTAHAELMVIREAARALRTWRLPDTTLYVTLEPCLMCAGAVILARIPRLVFGAPDPKAGACGSLFAVHDDPRLNHRVTVTRGILEDDCRDQLRQFFQQVRHDRLVTMP